MVLDGTVNGVVNTVAETAIALRDGFEIRRAATERLMPCYTSMDTARVAVETLVSGGVGYTVQSCAAYVDGTA